MTLSIILWTAALAIFFGITNAISYKRGFYAGWDNGYATKVTFEDEEV